MPPGGSWWVATGQWTWPRLWRAELAAAECVLGFARLGLASGGGDKRAALLVSYYWSDGMMGCVSPRSLWVACAGAGGLRSSRWACLVQGPSQVFVFLFYYYIYRWEKMVSSDMLFPTHSSPYLQLYLSPTGPEHRWC